MEEVGHELVEVQTSGASVDAVVFVGIDAELKLLVGSMILRVLD